VQRVMSYIESGKAEGATLHVGGSQVGSEGYFIQPTVFTDCKPDMKIVKEEIFGPVGVFIKFKDEAGTCGDGIQSPIRLMNNRFGKDVIEQANDTTYGLAAAVFSQNINRAIRVAHALEAGTAWVRRQHMTIVSA
jgi:aldehyde dehydrogenase (NAD+)